MIHRATTLPPGIYVLPPQQSFGTAEKQQQAIGRFEIFNNLSRTVKIVKTELSCGCSELRLSKNELSPGERANASLIVDLSQKFGEQHFQALLVTDDPVQPSLVL